MNGEAYDEWLQGFSAVPELDSLVSSIQIACDAAHRTNSQEDRKSIHELFALYNSKLPGHLWRSDTSRHELTFKLDIRQYRDCRFEKDVIVDMRTLRMRLPEAKP